jgi:hypothetical protein
MMVRATALQRYVPLGLRREDAATFIGVGPTKFDEMVSDGRMPLPRCIDSRRVWDRNELEAAFDELPRQESTNSKNPWDTL